jgi:CMP-2-keto-3-deoxyoctulosonic acid synthetase
MSYGYTTFIQMETSEVLEQLRELKNDYAMTSQFVTKLDSIIEKAERAKESGETIDNFFSGRWGHEGIEEIIGFIRG